MASTARRRILTQGPVYYLGDTTEKRLGPGVSSILLDGAGSVKIKRPGENPITLEHGAAYEITVGSDGSLAVSKTVTNPVDLGKRSGAPNANATLDASHDGVHRTRDAETRKLARINELHRKMWER